MYPFLVNTETQSVIEAKESTEKYKTTTVFGTGLEDFSLDNLDWVNPALKTSTKETTFAINMEEESGSTYEEETNDHTDDYDINYKPTNSKIKMKVKIKSVREHEPKAIL